MESNVPLNHTLYVYLTLADNFGDGKALGTPREIPATVEKTDGWENDQFADVNTGVLSAFIAPDTAFYVEQGGKFNGLLAQFAFVGDPGDGDWYRIASVHPGESLVDGTPDLVELTLARVTKRPHEDA